MEKLKQVEQPTSRITDDIQRFDERENGFSRAFRGDFGEVVVREGRRFVSKYPMNAALGAMTGYLTPVVNGEVAPSKAPLPEDPEILTHHIKRLGYYVGADIVGVCRLPQYAVYSHRAPDGKPVELDHQFAILGVVDQDYGTMSGSTGHDWISGSQSFRSYSISAFIAVVMANYIRRLGYPARAHHVATYKVVLPPLLLLSGIGEMCRAGIVLNPFLGTRFKASVVTTDLPLVPDKPVDFGLQDFCRKCQKCALECPSKAISSGDTVMYNGYEVWRFDVERCSRYRVTNPNGSICGRCIKVCPWNKQEGWTHDRVR